MGKQKTEKQKTVKKKRTAKNNKTQKARKIVKQKSDVEMDISPSTKLTPSTVPTLQLSKKASKRANASSSKQLDSLIDRFAKLEIPKTRVKISFVIFGHGEIVNDPKNTFTKPEIAESVNLLAIKHAGISNIGNREYEEDIGKILGTKHFNIFDFKADLNARFIKFVEGFKNDSNLENEPEKKKTVDRIEQLRNKYDDNFFEIEENYGSNTHKQAQKKYYGLNAIESEEKNKGNIYRHSQLTPNGPLIQIYSISVDDNELVKKNESVYLTLKNEINLTETIEEVVQQLRITSNILTPGKFEGKMDIYVVDLTCNYTNDLPTIGFFKNEKKKS